MTRWALRLLFGKEAKDCGRLVEEQWENTRIHVGADMTFIPIGEKIMAKEILLDFFLRYG